jgi:cardiolipin synthase
MFGQTNEERAQELPGVPVRGVQSKCKWLASGDEMFAAMTEAIQKASSSICFETYIYSAGQPGERLRDALVEACRRGVRVRVLIDAVGSYNLPAGFWSPLLGVGGEARWFNPVALDRLGLRNHRKLVVCDGAVALVGGVNIAPEYQGDGVTHGWCDLGLRIEGPLAAQLQESFEQMHTRAEFRHKRFIKLRRRRVSSVVGSASAQLLLSGPGRGRNPFQQALARDLENAETVQMMVAYFLPTWRLRRQIAGVAHRGGKVQILLGGKSDVALSLLAGRSLYRRLLKTSIEVFEYQPQILHGKLYIIDDVVYVGSANLDQRSLKINYELMVRFHDPEVACEARKVFEKSLRHAKQITLSEWRRSRSLWQRLKQRWAYFLLVRVDPYIARRQWQALPD